MNLTIVLPRFPTETDFKRDIDKKKPSTGTLLKFKENKDVITSTTKSSLITSTFFLEVSCPMSGCCPNLPKAQCPIGIFSPDFQLPPVTAPQNWRPVTLNNVNIVFPPHQNETNEPLLKGEQMTEAKMLGNNGLPHQVSLEIAQAQSSHYPPENQMSYNIKADPMQHTTTAEYNQTYFQKFS